MENFKIKALATLKIAEKALLILVGAAAVALSFIDPRFETLKLGVQVSGLVCIVFGLTPMFWAYIKETLPKKNKK